MTETQRAALITAEDAFRRYSDYHKMTGNDAKAVSAIALADKMAAAQVEPATEDFSVAFSQSKPEPVAWMLEKQTMSGDTTWVLSWSRSGAGVCNRLIGESHERPLYDTPQIDESVLDPVDQDLLLAWLANGDDGHREWLRKAIAAFFSSGKWPEPIGMSDLEAERTARQTAQRQLADLQELQAKSGLAHRKAVQDAVAGAMKTAADIAEILQSKLGGTRNYSGLDDDEIELWDKCQSLIDSARCKS